MNGCLGAVIGAVTTLSVDGCLFEITLNPFFTFYFGLMFIIIGGLMLFNIFKKTPQEEVMESFSNDQSFLKREKDSLILLTAVLIIVSGIACFFLRNNWSEDFYLIPKLVVYLMIGISLSYIVIFGIIDFFNFLTTFFRSNNSFAFVESRDQILTLLVTSIVLGSYYGLIYGFVRIEKNHSSL